MNPELWRDRPLLAVLALLTIVLGSAWMWAAPRLVQRASARVASVLAWLTWMVTRPGLAILVWGVLGHRTSDLLDFFLPYARGALAGRLPYRDFACAHGPLFPYLLAGALVLAGPLGITSLFVLADLVAWRLLAARDRHRGAGPLDGAAWAYLAFTPVWLFTVRYQQDEALAAPFLAAALLAAERDRPGRAGLWLAAGTLCTKLLFVGVALPWLLPGAVGEARVRRMALACLLPLAAVYGALLAARIPALQPLVLHESWFGSGPTLWRIPFVFWKADLGLVGWAPWLALTTGGLAWLVARRAPRLGLAAWVFGAFALLSPKFYPFYVVMWAPALAAWVAAGGAGRARAWVLYGLVISLWPVLDSGPLQGLFGPGPRVLAVAGTLACIMWALGLLVSAGRGAGIGPAESVSV